jgi:hypothetical protein
MKENEIQEQAVQGPRHKWDNHLKVSHMEYQDVNKVGQEQGFVKPVRILFVI